MAAEAAAGAAGGPSPVARLERMVLLVEDACLSGAPLSDVQLSQLEELSGAIPATARATAAEDPIALRSFAHRLWRACAAEAAPRSLPATCRALLWQRACELFEAASGALASTGRATAGAVAPQPEEQALLASQWALAGRAWAVAGADGEALRCLGAAAAAWEAHGRSATGSRVPAVATRLAEVAFQANIWSSDAHFRRGAGEASCAALARARDALDASPELRQALLGDLTAACYERAVAYRAAGSPQHAVEVLTLALAASPAPTAGALPAAGRVREAQAAAEAPGGAASRAQLLRHLALSYSDQQDRALAAAHARAAAALGPPGSRHQAQSLEVLLRVLCQLAERPPPGGAAAVADPSSEEARAAALELVRHPAAPAEDCLSACASLLEQSWPVDVVFSLLSDLSVRVQGDPASYAAVLHFRLHVAEKEAEAVVRSAEHSDAHPACARLLALVKEVEALGAHGSGSEAAAQAVLALRRLAHLAIGARNFGGAARWMERALPLVQDPRGLAECLAAEAACLRWAGRAEEARAAAERALAADAGNLDATLIALLGAVEQGDAGADQARSLLQKALRINGIQPKHVACIAHAMLRHPQQDVAFMGLEALALHLMEKEGAPDQPKCGLPVDALAVLSQLLEHAEKHQLPTPQLLRYLALVDQHVAKTRAGNAPDEDAPGAGHVRRIAAVAWARGQEHGRQMDWPQCLEVFETMLRIFDNWGAEDAQDLLEVRVWCFVMAASARVQLAKERFGEGDICAKLCERALHCLDRAHQLCRRGGGLSQGRVFVVLVLLEFETRCLAGEPEMQLKRYVDEASAHEAIGVQSLLAMSKIAGVASCRRLAIHCLQRFLRMFVGLRGASDCSPCAAAYREMIALHASRNETFEVYEGILHLLSGGGNAGPGAGPLYPKEELAWLVATAWNNGCHFFRLQQYKWGERWMGRSLALAKFCPGAFPEEGMRASYVECLQHCGE